VYVGDWRPGYCGVCPMVDGGKAKVKTAYDIPDESAVPIDIVSTALDCVGSSPSTASSPAVFLRTARRAGCTVRAKSDGRRRSSV
jgi:hypothetical protein